MNRKLSYEQNKHRRLFAWLAVYVLIIFSIFSIIYYVTTRLRTHTLPVGSISLVIPYSQYAAGEPITFQMVNNLNSSIYVINECPAEPLNVYIWQDSAWVRIHDQANPNDCPAENRKVAVAPNSSLSGDFNAWPNLFAQAGKYRVVAVIEHYNALPYQDFEVVSPPTSVAPAVNQQTNVNIPTVTRRRPNNDD